VLTRALQGEPISATFAELEVQKGDRWLLCSDGLSGVVPAKVIEATLADGGEPGDCAERLLDLALRGGGPDNITVVVADLAER